MATVRFYRNNTDDVITLNDVCEAPGSERVDLPPHQILRVVSEAHPEIDLNQYPDAGLVQIDQVVQPWETHEPSILVFDPEG